MNKEKFIEELLEIFELDVSTPDVNTVIQMDSLSVLSIIALADKALSKKLSASEFESVVENNPTINDVLLLCGFE